MAAPALLGTAGLRALLFALFIGSAASAIRTLEGMVIPSIFGTAQLGAICGFVQALTVAASAFGPIALAIAREATGSYAPALVTSAALPFAIALCALFTHMPARNP